MVLEGYDRYVMKRKGARPEEKAKGIAMPIKNNRTRHMLFPAISALAVFSALFGFVTRASAQQWTIDDAAITTARSFQIETWHGPERFWFMPALGVNSSLELSMAFAFAADQSYGLAGWVLEAKVVTADLDDVGQAFSLTVGSVFDAESSFTGGYAYVPYSRSIPGVNSIIHVNIGGVLKERKAGGELSIIYGIRWDFALHERFMLLAELSAENRDFGFNAGARVGLIPNLLTMDISYGRGFTPDWPSSGWIVGLAFTPPSLW